MSARKKTGGRRAGTPNKATAEIRVLAREYSGQALQTLAAIMSNSTNDQARIAAARELLDRAYGKPTQAVDFSGEVPGHARSAATPTIPEYEAALRRVLAEY